MDEIDRARLLADELFRGLPAYAKTDEMKERTRADVMEGVIFFLQDSRAISSGDLRRAILKEGARRGYTADDLTLEVHEG